MNVPIDIHTHHAQGDAGRYILNFSPCQSVSMQSPNYYSVGIHPWDVPAWFTPENCEQLTILAKRREVVAIGETGIDKLSGGAMDVQLKAFVHHARLAEEVEKPLIVHCVKGMEELLAVKKDIRPRQAWILHGFRGNPTQAGQLLAHGLYLSFGERLNEETVRSVPTDRLFAETDMGCCGIECVLQHIATLRGEPLPQVVQTVARNVRRIFFREKVATSD